MLRLCMGFSLLRPGGRRAPWKGARPSAFSGSPSSLPLQRLYCGPQAGRFSFACAPRAPFRPFSPARFARARRRQLFAFCGPAAAAVSGHAYIKQGPPQRGSPALYAHCPRRHCKVLTGAREAAGACCTHTAHSQAPYMQPRPLAPQATRPSCLIPRPWQTPAAPAE